MAVCDSLVLLLAEAERDCTLHLFNVNAVHFMISVGSVTLKQPTKGLACTRRGNNTYVAFAHVSLVSLYLLESQSLLFKPLASFTLEKPHLLLFCGDLLLVADWNETTKTPAIVSLRAFGKGLNVLLDADAGIEVGAWAIAGDRLVLWNQKSKHLLVSLMNLFA